MSLLLCPLCGKATSLRNYDPSTFDDDIYARDVRGLGRGRGFAVIGQHSILDDREVTRLIGTRAVKIVALLLRHRVLSRNEILACLEIHTEEEAVLVLQDKLNSVRANQDRWIRYDNTLKTENVALKERNAQLQTEKVSLSLQVALLNGARAQLNQDVNHLFFAFLTHLLRKMNSNRQVEAMVQDVQLLQNLVALTQNKPSFQFLSDRELGWKIVIHQPNPTIMAILEQVSIHLSHQARTLFVRHLETTNPAAQQAIKQLGYVL